MGLANRLSDERATPERIRAEIERINAPLAPRSQRLMDILEMIDDIENMDEKMKLKRELSQKVDV